MSSNRGLMKHAVFVRMTRSVHGRGSEIQPVFQKFTLHQVSAHSLADLISLNPYNHPIKEGTLTSFFYIYKRENGAWRDQGICPRSWGLSSGSLNPEPVLQATDFKLMVLATEQSDHGHFF